jgi:hypothetical protein
MKNLSIALSIGLIAGVIDVIPMLFQGIDKFACLSAFIQWLVLGLIIPFIKWKIAPWLKGLLVGELAALPIMILVFEKEPVSIIPIMIFSAVLGTFVGIAGAKLIK